MGAKPGRMKGNEQEAEYEEPGKKAWETRRKRRWKTGKPKGKPEALEQHTERQSQEEGNGRNRKPSSWNRNRSGRKEAEGKRKIPKAKAKGKHLWNSCGSEAGKSERKRTES